MSFFFASNANSFFEDFHLQCFVAKNALQLADSFFQGIYFGNAGDLVIGFNGCFPPSLICFLLR